MSYSCEILTECDRNHFDEEYLFGFLLNRGETTHEKGFLIFGSSSSHLARNDNDDLSRQSARLYSLTYSPSSHNLV